MAWSTPRTWAASETVTATMMNQHVRDNLSYLYGVPSGGTFLRLTSNQSLSSGSESSVSWSSEVYDDLGAWTSGTNITIPSNGYYSFMLSLRFSMSGAYNNFRYYAGVYNNTDTSWLSMYEGATSNANPQYPGFMAYGEGNCDASDVILARAYQVTGVSQNIYGGTGNDRTFLIIRKLGDQV